MLISCDCSIDYDPGCNDLQFSELRKARKRHTCGECDRAIEPGERYEHATQLYDGGWSHHKTCLGCYNIRQHLCRYGWVWGSVAEQVEACVGYNYVTGKDAVYREW